EHDDGEHRGDTGHGRDRRPGAQPSAAVRLQQPGPVHIGRLRLAGAPACAGRREHTIDLAVDVAAGPELGVVLRLRTHPVTSSNVRSFARASARVDLTVPWAQPMTAAVSAIVRPTK